MQVQKRMSITSPGLLLEQSWNKSPAVIVPIKQEHHQFKEKGDRCKGVASEASINHGGRGAEQIKATKGTEEIGAVHLDIRLSG